MLGDAMTNRIPGRYLPLAYSTPQAPLWANLGPSLETYPWIPQALRYTRACPRLPMPFSGPWPRPPPGPPNEKMKSKQRRNQKWNLVLLLWKFGFGLGARKNRLERWSVLRVGHSRRGRSRRGAQNTAVFGLLLESSR